MGKPSRQLRAGGPAFGAALCIAIGLSSAPFGAESAAASESRAARITARALDRGLEADFPAFARDGCTSGQTNDLDAEAGIEDEARVQTPCLPGQPGNAGDLTGFAFVVHGCLDGGIGEIAVCFGSGELDDIFYLMVWRSVGGLPADACGLAAYGARLHVQDEYPHFSIYDICDARVPITEGERIFIGVIYRNITQLFGPDWFFARNSLDGFSDLGYVNLSGDQGDWVDMDSLNLGLGNRWGVIMTNLTTCAPVAVEEASWGAVKVLLR